MTPAANLTARGSCSLSCHNVSQSHETAWSSNCDKTLLTGLGILQVRALPARMGRNPATGEAIKIKASKKIAFRAAKGLKESV